MNFIKEKSPCNDFWKGANNQHGLFCNRKMVFHFSVQMSGVQKLHIAKGVAYGIQFMQSYNPLIIHQDIKPPNVMVGQFCSTITACLYIHVCNANLVV